MTQSYIIPLASGTAPKQLPPLILSGARRIRGVIVDAALSTIGVNVYTTLAPTGPFVQVQAGAVVGTPLDDLSGVYVTFSGTPTAAGQVRIILSDVPVAITNTGQVTAVISGPVTVSSITSPVSLAQNAQTAPIYVQQAQTSPYPKGSVPFVSTNSAVVALNQATSPGACNLQLLNVTMQVGQSVYLLGVKTMGLYRQPWVTWQALWSESPVLALEIGGLFSGDWDDTFSTPIILPWTSASSGTGIIGIGWANSGTIAPIGNLNVSGSCFGYIV